jgi:hypothetical protein
MTAKLNKYTNRVYISGPMTGQPQFNFQAFNEAAKELRARGFKVVNPAENFGGRTDLDRRTYLAHDIRQITRVDAVVVLPGWQGSRGACLEVAVARGLDMPVLDASTLQPVLGT